MNRIGSIQLTSVWWTVAMALSMYLCMRTICCVWSKWKHNPVILNFNTKTTSIGEIPFPAVTICPVTKMSKTKLDYTAVYRALLNLDGNYSHTVTQEQYFGTPFVFRFFYLFLFLFLFFFIFRIRS